MAYPIQPPSFAYSHQPRYYSPPYYHAPRSDHSEYSEYDWPTVPPAPRAPLLPELLPSPRPSKPPQPLVPASLPPPGSSRKRDGFSTPTLHPLLFLNGGLSWDLRFDPTKCALHRAKSPTAYPPQTALLATDPDEPATVPPTPKLEILIHPLDKRVRLLSPEGHAHVSVRQVLLGIHNALRVRVPQADFQSIVHDPQLVHAIEQARGERCTAQLGIRGYHDGGLRAKREPLRYVDWLLRRHMFVCLVPSGKANEFILLVTTPYAAP